MTLYPRLVLLRNTHPLQDLRISRLVSQTTMARNTANNGQAIDAVNDLIIPKARLYLMPAHADPELNTQPSIRLSILALSTLSFHIEGPCHPHGRGETCFYFETRQDSIDGPLTSA